MQAILSRSSEKVDSLLEAFEGRPVPEGQVLHSYLVESPAWRSRMLMEAERGHQADCSRPLEVVRFGRAAAVIRQVCSSLADRL